MDSSTLKQKIIASLKEQGFKISNGRISPPKNPTKDQLRELHQGAVEEKRRKSGRRLKAKEPRLLDRIASAEDVKPKEIKPKLVEVKRRSEDELLFRYASLHWSIPVSSGYGRRLRFLVIDESNEKLIGLIGLGDPVFRLSARDEWIRWSDTRRKENLRHVLDAFVLGAVPPYSFLLCGKLVAMLVASDIVRLTFENKYKDRTAIISGRKHDGTIALITTTSALGRSSIYNRLTMNDRKVYIPVGFTRGSGDFHFSNGLYDKIYDFAENNTTATAKNDKWGNGYRNRREVINKVLSELDLSQELTYHGVKREIYVIPLAVNTRTFLCNKNENLEYYRESVGDITNAFKERWLLDRLDRMSRAKEWCKKEWLLWNSPKALKEGE